MIDYDQILPNLYVGTCPRDLEDLKILKRLGISAVLNLQTDEDLQSRKIEWPALAALYQRLGIEAHRVPMMDFDYEDQRERLPEAVSVLEGLLAGKHIVYLHCNAGVGRSPLVAMAYLYWCRKLQRQEAVRHVRTCRNCSPYEDLLDSRP